MTAYTASSLKHLLNCSQYENDKQGSNFEAERGSIIHALLADIDENTIKTKGLEYRGEFKQLQFEHDFVKYNEIVKNVTQATFTKISAQNEIHQEIEIIVAFGEDAISGILDLVVVGNLSLFIFDWKTGRTRYDVKDVTDSLQSVVYILLACKSYNFKKATFGYVYIDDNGLESIVTVERTVNQCEEIIKNWLSEVKKGDKNICDSCQYCKHKNTCEVVSKEVAIIEKQATNVIEYTIEYTKENYKKMKNISKIIEKWVDGYKNNASDDDFYFRTSYLLDTSKLSDDEKLKLVKEKVSITKEELNNFDSDLIETKKIKVLK